MSDYNADTDIANSTIIEMYDALYHLPDRNRLILFYIRHLIDSQFPIEDYEALRDEMMKII